MLFICSDPNLPPIDSQARLMRHFAAAYLPALLRALGQEVQMANFEMNDAVTHPKSMADASASKDLNKREFGYYLKVTKQSDDHPTDRALLIPDKNKVLMPKGASPKAITVITEIAQK